MPADPKSSQKRYSNSKSIAHTMGVSSRSVTEWARKGCYSVKRTPGGHYRIEIDEDGWPVQLSKK